MLQQLVVLMCPLSHTEVYNQSFPPSDHSIHALGQCETQIQPKSNHLLLGGLAQDQTQSDKMGRTLQALLLSTTLAASLAIMNIQQNLFTKQSVSSSSWAASQREEVSAPGLVECALLCQADCTGFRSGPKLQLSFLDVNCI